jgi:hydroxymethylpyrimidine/phosphomethylpyrimidine kinase
MKGGHIDGPRVIDLLMTPASLTRFDSGRIDSRHTHGTGCTLASACATGLAQGFGLEAAVARARDYLRGAILHAPGLGAGHGPLNHGWRVGRV